MFLLQVATLWTCLNVGLREGDTERDSEQIVETVGQTVVEETVDISGISILRALNQYQLIIPKTW